MSDWMLEIPISAIPKSTAPTNIKTSISATAIGTWCFLKKETSGRKIFDKNSATTNGSRTGCIICSAAPTTTIAMAKSENVIALLFCMSEICKNRQENYPITKESFIRNSE